jgi:hypothetical protein
VKWDFFTNDTRQVSGAQAGIKAAHLWPNLPEFGRIGGNGQSTNDMQHMAAAHSISR